MSSISAKLAAMLRLGCLSTALSASLCFGFDSGLQKTTLENVSIGSNTYDVTFWQTTGGLTSFNQVFGSGSRVLTFHNAADALAAATAIRSAAEAIDFDYTTASDDLNAFTIAFDYTDEDFSLISGWSDKRLGYETTPPNTFARDDLFGTGFVTFDLQQSVPETPAIALIGLGLAALGFSRRRRG